MWETRIQILELIKKCEAVTQVIYLAQIYLAHLNRVYTHYKLQLAKINICSLKSRTILILIKSNPYRTNPYP